MSTSGRPMLPDYLASILNDCRGPNILRFCAQSTATMKAGVEDEDELQQLRSRATELLLREDWHEYINLYTHFISNAPQDNHLCLALSNRALARYRLHHLSPALDDCDRALAIDPTHLKSLICKGKTLLALDRYAHASDCFQRVLATAANDPLRRLLARCKQLEAQSRTGVFDLSDWVVNGFSGSPPELAEYVGAVEIRQSAISGGGRGLFATKNIEAGTPLIVTKAVVIGRGISPDDSGKMLMWKDFVDQTLIAVSRSAGTLERIYTLSSGGGQEEVPNTEIFMPGALISGKKPDPPDVSRILRILDVNCLSEQSASAATAMGTARGVSGVGLWVLPSFVNHSCCPNARRLHVGDQTVVIAARDLKAAEEITFAYFDVLVSVGQRREMARRWGFECRCERCGFEEGLGFGGEAVGVEEEVARLRVKGRGVGFVRASNWAAYEDVYGSERERRRWGRQVPAEEVMAESVAAAVGGDERVLRAVVRRWRKGGGGVGEMEERVMRLGRGVYGRVMKKQAMRVLLDEL